MNYLPSPINKKTKNNLDQKERKRKGKMSKEKIMNNQKKN